jgi:hypothetical protein
LVNIGNATVAQIPSKVVEYVAAGKPILNVVTREDDSTAEFLKRYPLALTVNVGGAQSGEWLEGAPVAPASLDLAAERIADFLTHPPNAPAEVLAAWRERFSIHKVASDYAAMIGLTQGGASGG